MVIQVRELDAVESALMARSSRSAQSASPYQWCPSGRRQAPDRALSGIALVKIPGLHTGELREAARKIGWRSLRQLAWAKVQQGIIPISEQDRWTRMIDPELLKV